MQFKKNIFDIFHRTKDGYPLRPDPRFKLAEFEGNCYLCIENVQPDDLGMYACVITNRAGRAITSGSLKFDSKLFIQLVINMKFID